MGGSGDLWRAVSTYSSFLITCHVRPDPDAVGSEIALALFFEKLGKVGRIVNESPLPEMFTFLPQWERIRMYPEGMDFAYDAIVCLDAPDIKRAGVLAEAAEQHPLIIVDHHPYENRMADVVWIEPSASSTGEMLYDFMSHRRDLIDAAIASCLYVAIMTDTGRFSYANTSGKALEAAADLVRLGADPYALARDYYENVTDGQIRLLGVAAANMRRAAEGRVAVTTLSAKDFERAGAGPEAAAELAELPRTLKGVEIGALVREVAGGTKVSLRSKGEADVKEIAEHFGGGGHHKASGFFLELPLAEAEIVVTKFLEEHLAGRSSK